MAKKIRPSLKDYLRTGVVRFNDDGEPAAASPLADGRSPSSALLADRKSTRLNSSHW